jgi:hypothetical protein
MPISHDLVPGSWLLTLDIDTIFENILGPIRAFTSDKLFFRSMVPQEILPDNFKCSMPISTLLVGAAINRLSNSPPLPPETAAERSKDGNRTPIEGKLPICCVDFEPESGEQIVRCKASCGNNIHKTA